MRDPRITSDPDTMMGKPVVTGTRITVEHILEMLAGGESIADLVSAHPRLTREDVQAALQYAADELRAAVVHPVDPAAA